MSKLQTEPAGANNPRIERAFANLKAKAAAIGWTCLDTDWHGQHGEYQFVCAQGHRLSRIAYVFLKKSGSCAQCKGQAIAKQCVFSTMQDESREPQHYGRAGSTSSRASIRS